LENEGRLQPAPAPKFSKTPQSVGRVPSLGQHTREIMEMIGFPNEKVALLLSDETT
jgi:alpha-methylacyl-CoA racemase